MYTIDLNTDWLVRYEMLDWGLEKYRKILDSTENWLKTDLPCDVHMPLIRDGIIKDPVEADNSFNCEWVEDKSWWFQKRFNIIEKMLEDDVIELTLDSLDSEADIFLNGVHLGHHKSAFYPFALDVKENIKRGENILLIRVTSGLEYYSENDIARIKNFVGSEGVYHRGDKRRPFVRKPQYVYGWDWGPRVASCGIMKGARIKSYKKLVIRGVRAYTKSISKDAQVGFEVELENLHPYSTVDASVRIDVYLKGRLLLNLSEELLVRSGLNYIDLSGTICSPKLWWPNGMGRQDLYTIKVNAVVNNDVIAEYPDIKLGIRTLRLIQDKIGPDERNFIFEINGIKTFCKGGDWIPADSIYARVSDEKYDILVREAKEANFNMLRIWGGGIYERNIFYEKCDEYGIMLWHDFMFACAMYPDDLTWFKDEVEREIDYQTKRLRNHPSLVLWCGNNENTWGFDEWWIKIKPSFLGGAHSYNIIAPSLVHKNCPDIPYWNCSPYGGEHPNGNDAGDRHHWHDCMMNPEMNKRITPEEYDKVKAKFVSEYGYVGPCRKSSIIRYHGGSPLDKKGEIWQIHNNTFEKETVPAGIEKHYTNPDTLNIDEYLLYAGLCQGLMLGYSLEALRFNEGCWGGLFWMYNDCWGEVGWTIIDYYLKRKVSYYYVKRALAPVKLIMREKDGQIIVMGINDTKDVIEFDANYGYTAFNGKYTDIFHATIKLEPFSRKVVLKFTKDSYDLKNGLYFIMPLNNNLMPAALQVNDFKNLIIPESTLKITDIIQNTNNVSMTISSDVYAHAVHFNLDDTIRLSDEYFDLLPGEKRNITIYDVPDNFSIKDINPVSIKL